MRITCITPAISNRYIKRDYEPQMVANPTFRAGLWFNSFYKSPLTKLKNVTVEEYKQLSLFDLHSIRRSIRRVYGSSLNEDMKFNYVAASGIKRTLDKIYGENNYVVVTIGRSVSSIGKCLGYKIGENNVKQIPMSNAKRFLYMENLQDENLDIFKKYLNSKGLSKWDVRTSGKHYIITDYCCSGQSLLGAELLLSNHIWDEQPNVMAINVSRLIGSIEPNEIFPEFKMSNRDFIYNIEDKFADNFFKEYSLVLKCKKLDETPNAVITPENHPKIKSFFFKLLDCEMQATSK